MRKVSRAKHDFWDVLKRRGGGSNRLLQQRVGQKESNFCRVKILLCTYPYVV